jgi:predicted DNA-binding protein
MPDAMQDSLSPQDVTEAVRETALLASISISLWGAERNDRQIMDQVKVNAGATGNVGRAVKNLMAGADGALKDVRSAFMAVRLQHYQLTLPWVSDPHAERQRGPRLLPNALFDRYMTMMGLKRRSAMQALDAFIAAYPQDIQTAQANLAGLAKPEDYPDPAEVRAMFKIAFDFEPIPSGHAFAGLPDSTLEKLGAALERKQKVMLDTAAQAMWRELRERVDYLASRLEKPDAAFKAATLSNVQELADLVPAWNVKRDTRADEVVADIHDALGRLDAATLRGNEQLRAETATRVRAITDKLSSWGL